jgi:chaperone modulatory protein CbpM
MEGAAVMNAMTTAYLDGQVIEEQVQLSLVELCQACRAQEAEVAAWVFEGVLQPTGAQPASWRFAGESLRRARMALRIARDLEVNAAGVALALDLLDEIAALEARVRSMRPA